MGPNLPELTGAIQGRNAPLFDRTFLEHVREMGEAGPAALQLDVCGEEEEEEEEGGRGDGQAA